MVKWYHTCWMACPFVPWCAILCIYGILPKEPYPSCLCMADRALLTGYPRLSQTDWCYNRCIRIGFAAGYCRYQAFPLLTINSLRDKFFRGNINTYLHFMPFLHTEMLKIIEILSRMRPGLILHNQYHGCWCPCGARSQGISNHDIDLVIPR